MVELRTPAMPFGSEAFVAVKLRSLCWQQRFEQGWYCRESEGHPEQQRYGRKCDQVPGKEQSAAGSAKKKGRKQTCVCARYQC